MCEGDIGPGGVALAAAGDEEEEVEEEEVELECAEARASGGGEEARPSWARPASLLLAAVDKWPTVCTSVGERQGGVGLAGNRRRFPRPMARKTQPKRERERDFLVCHSYGVELPPLCELTCAKAGRPDEWPLQLQPVLSRAVNGERQRRQ